MGTVDSWDLMMQITWVINISSITKTGMGRFNTQNPTYCEENQRATEKTNYILDKLSTE